MSIRCGTGHWSNNEFHHIKLRHRDNFETHKYSYYIYIYIQNNFKFCVKIFLHFEMQKGRGKDSLVGKIKQVYR